VALPPLKLLHTADVHLDVDGFGASAQAPRYRQIVQQAFSAVIDVAIQEAVDALLIAGDLFDSNRPSAAAVDFAIQEVRRAGRPVILIPGNHDCLQAHSIYHRVNFAAACPNLLLLTHPRGERHWLPERHLVVWGRGMIEHEPGYRPLAGLPRRQGEAWHIALGHGFFMADGSPPSRSSPIYAGEIRASGWDYVALGHCHALLDVSQAGVTAYYAGAPGFFPGAQGADGHAVLVHGTSAEGRRIEVTPIDLRPRVYAALRHAR
jgi:DNA repair exonuclease SbcCD nuclease subunit